MLGRLEYTRQIRPQRRCCGLSGAPTLLSVQSESVLVVPLRSNANTLVAGTPVAALRRRLKFASLFFDRLFLETGIYRVNAGPRGASSFIVPPSETDPPRWQTAADRHARTGRKFTVAFSEEPPPGGDLRVLVTSEASIAWDATLHPFADELPAGANWIEFVTSANPAGEVNQVAQRWTREDEGNSALQRAIPVPFVRGEVIKSTNRDLALAAAAGVAVTVDPLHQQVAAQRFNDPDAWKFRGYAVPLLFPWIGDLSWEEIADLRRDRQMARFRAELQEVEEEAMAAAADGDLKTAAEHVYRRHLADYSETLPSVGGIAHRTLTGFVIGGIAGFYVYGIVGPLGTVAGAALGAAGTTVIDIREVILGRRSRGWICMNQRIEALRP
jgi:hypothetical protein